MKSDVSSYAKYLLFVTIALGILALALFLMLPKTWFSPSLPFLFIFYYACSLLSFILLSRSLEKKFNRFVSVFMLTTTVKLFLFIAIMIIYAFINRKDAVSFLLNFFILYLVYTVFEVTQIIRLTKSSGTS
jgi:hypothetical protein